jgi:hypothetical protein
MTTPNPICEEVRELLPAYGLDALPSDEAHFVERHLDLCAECRAESRQFAEAGALLALAVPPQLPSPSARGRLLQAAQQELGRPSVEPRRLPRISPMWGAVAASIIVSVGSLGLSWNLQNQVATAQVRADRYDRMVKVLASDQLTTKDLQPVSKGDHYYGSIFLDPKSGTGMVTVRGLPPLPEGRGWQLWYLNPATGEHMSGGLLRVDNSGAGYTIIECPSDLQKFETVGITQEPAQGSAWPTSPRVISTTLS